ncbi:hypothetical protein I302_105170 [Kwoniella bestiolae CBS 10118]|uniref:RAN protein binding protein n=1 Tax=Kwoniella bestiolae CBS 10118 TaxID=1296100 RepID=A0A1B9FSD5_9TREE|nr:hypothetical protein I302_08458 [Kwoniella bestiolae CBS 10118]OCF21681.1 hypothetical protein I302_08458 [Kwoniella bestiolae CBS 10118]
MSSSTAQTNGHADTTIPASTPAAAGSAQQNKIQPNDVGWQFVPQYYNFVNKQPHRLHCFYNKRSTFIHGEEGEESQVALGQQEIHDRIVAIGYNECKVYIHSIDSQSSANGGIIILVIGEMSNNHQPWRKFTQTFFLAEQPNGYFVLNDIFRYLKEDVDDEEEEFEEEIPEPQPQAGAEPTPAPVDIETKPAEQVTQEPAKAPEPEPEPITAPAEVQEQAVPEEATVASVPDKDVAPSEPAPAVEEPVTSAPPPPAEASPAPTPAAPKAAASPAPAPATPSPAPAPAAAAPAPPAQPAAPPKPKTWASLAASGGKAWSSAVVSNQAAASSAPAPAPTAAPKKEEAAPAASGSADKQSPAYANALRVNTPHCFVKLPNWSADNQAGGESLSENDLKNAVSRFGDVKKVEIVKAKACAFVEFYKVETARKAIIASLPASQGGEDGIKIEGHGKINLETRKEKDERRVNNGPQGPGGQGQRQSSGRGGPRQGQQPNGGQGQGGRGGQRNQGARGGRGGAQVNQGDRQKQ